MIDINFTNTKEIFLKFLALFFSGSLSLMLFGCAGHTIVSKTHYYPHDKNFNTADYRLEVVVHGEKRHAYTARTQKKIVITIWSNQKKLLNREYICTSASLEWDVTWNELGDLNILFFDFEEGISIYDKQVLEKQAKHILSLRFTFDAQKKEFTEYPVTKNIVMRVKGSIANN